MGEVSSNLWILQQQPLLTPKRTELCPPPESLEVELLQSSWVWKDAGATPQFQSQRLQTEGTPGPCLGFDLQRINPSHTSEQQQKLQVPQLDRRRKERDEEYPADVGQGAHICAVCVSGTRLGYSSLLPFLIFEVFFFFFLSTLQWGWHGKGKKGTLQWRH